MYRLSFLFFLLCCAWLHGQTSVVRSVFGSAPSAVAGGRYRCDGTVGQPVALRRTSLGELGFWVGSSANVARIQLGRYSGTVGSVVWVQPKISFSPAPQAGSTLLATLLFDAGVVEPLVVAKDRWRRGREGGVMVRADVGDTGTAHPGLPFLLKLGTATYSYLAIQELLTVSPSGDTTRWNTYLAHGDSGIAVADTCLPTVGTLRDMSVRFVDAVWPQPAETSLWLGWTAEACGSTANIYAECLSMAGTVALSQELVPCATASVDVSELPSGLWLLRLRSHGATQVIPFITVR